MINEESVFLNFACEESKIDRSRLVLGLPCNTLCYREVVFLSRFDIVEEEYIEKLKDKWENENTKNSTHGVLDKSFQNVGERKKSPSKFRIVYESDDQTLSQFYAFRNSVTSLSMLLRRVIETDPCKIKD